MIVSRSMDPDWLSNTYLVADEPGGHAVFIDAGGPIEPLLAKAAELDVRVTHILLTHEHHDHTACMMPLSQRYGATLIQPETTPDGTIVRSGSLILRALSTPGHCTPHISWLIEDEQGAPLAAFTGDTLFRGTVGGTLNGGPDGLAQLRSSILDVLLALPDETPLYPGHIDATTVGHERETNPFVHAFLNGPLEPRERVQVADTEAELLLESADYDGGTKVLVRFEDGREAIVGGSLVTHMGASR
ncbi:MAG: MBL fold metallo-hydrolase [Gaiellales bacterium]